MCREQGLDCGRGGPAKGGASGFPVAKLLAAPRLNQTLIRHSPPAGRPEAEQWDAVADAAGQKLAVLGHIHAVLRAQVWTHNCVSGCVGGTYVV